MLKQLCVGPGDKERLDACSSRSLNVGRTSRTVRARQQMSKKLVRNKSIPIDEDQLDAVD